MHPNYTVFRTEDGYPNDVAILVLKWDIVFLKDRVAAIELPESKENQYIGEHATVIGWGNTIPRTSSTSPVLQVTDQAVVECRAYPNTKNRLCGFADGTTGTL